MGIVGDNGASVKVSFSTQIKNIVFVWKSLPKTGADSEHFEPNTTYLEREGCTPEFSLSLFLDPGHLLFSCIFEDNQQLREKMGVHAGDCSGFVFFLSHFHTSTS